jgi:hypothetical protein
MKADDLIATAKTIAGNTIKFDQAAYDAARRALAQLIVVEANEMAETGSNEKDSIECLLDAVKHLFHWYEGETEEGETPDSSPMSVLELADKPDDMKDDSCECDCEACSEDKGCDSKMCKCGGMAAEADAEKSSHKCLECGCDKPADSHGRTDVSTAEMQELKSSEPDSDVSPSEDAPVEEVAVSDEAVEEEEEIESVKAALKAEIQKVQSLQTELEAAKALAVTQGQPKRFGKKFRDPNELVNLAAQYRAKALASTDPTLSKGYTELAEDFLNKSKKSDDE